MSVNRAAGGVETCQKSWIKAGLKTALFLSQFRGTISHCDYFSWLCPRGPVLPHTQRTHSSSGCCLFSLAPPLPPSLSRILGSKATCRRSVSVHTHLDTTLPGQVPDATWGKA